MLVTELLVAVTSDNNKLAGEMCFAHCCFRMPYFLMLTYAVCKTNVKEMSHTEMSVNACFLIFKEP